MPSDLLTFPTKETVIRVQRIGAIPLFSVLLFPVLLNLPELTNVFKTDPALRYSAIETHVQPGLLAGFPLIDPSIGAFHEALGKRSADQVLHGQTPWWNSFEGAGLPLAGEMNSSPFFPLMPLVELPHGQVYIQTLIQIIAGLATFMLLSELGLTSVAAVFGALLFEVNGTIAWLSGGWSYPIPFLPLLLYGIEKLRSAESRQRFQGSCWISISIAVSISAGFIEIAYLNGLLGFAWAMLRLCQAPRQTRWRFAGHLLRSGTVGIFLAAPIIIAFFDYINVAILGMHDGSAAEAHLWGIGIPQLLLPYVWGPIFYFAGQSPALGGQWGSVGGFAGFGTVVLAVAALFGTTQRSIRWLLASWIVLTLGATFGAPVIQEFVIHWPGLKFAAYYRYFDASWELALAILAAFAINDSIAVSRQALRTRLVVGIAFVSVACWIGLAISWDVVRKLWLNSEYPVWFVTSLSLAAAVALTIYAATWLPWARYRAVVLGVVVTLEAAIFFLIPTLSYPVAGSLATGGVDYLKRNIGFQRMYSLGPIAPNYGSYFGIASINHDDLPLAKLWANYVSNRLDPYPNPLLFTGTYPPPNAGIPSREEELRRNLSGYEEVGVKYVLTFPGDHLSMTAFEPKAVVGSPRPLPLRNGASAELRVAVPAGRLSGIEILQATYDGTADGNLAVQLCVQHVCLHGAGSLAEAPNNKYFIIPFTSQASVAAGTATITFRHVGGTHAEALYVSADASHVTERVTVDDHRLSGKMLPVHLLYAAGPVETPVQLSNNVAYGLPSGQEARIDLISGIPTGTIDAVSVFQATYGGTADGSLKLRICSGHDCTQSVRRLQESPDNDFLQFHLQKPFSLTDRPRITLQHVGGNHPEALWLWPPMPGAEQKVSIDGVTEPDKVLRLRFNFVALNGAPSLVYKDEGMEIYRLAHPAPYFKAAGCAIDAASRTSVEAFCKGRSTLRRLELFMPGWSVNVNGGTVPIRLSNNAFQAVDLEPGRSRVFFSFTPPYMAYGYVAFFIACVAMVVQLWFAVGGIPRVVRMRSGPSAEHA